MMTSELSWLYCLEDKNGTVVIESRMLDDIVNYFDKNRNSKTEYRIKLLKGKNNPIVLQTRIEPMPNVNDDLQRQAYNLTS